MRIGPPCAILLLAAPPCHAQQPRYAPVGLFIGAIEEGARIFTPIRLLPFDHPEAQGHQFPNALALHRSEFDLLVALGSTSPEPSSCAGRGRSGRVRGRVAQ